MTVKELKIECAKIAATEKKKPKTKERPLLTFAGKSFYGIISTTGWGV